MKHDHITLTADLLDKAKTESGGYTKQQLAVFDIQWPPKRGWKKSLIGKRVAIQEYEEFVNFGM